MLKFSEDLFGLSGIKKCVCVISTTEITKCNHKRRLRIIIAKRTDLQKVSQTKIWTDEE